LAEIIGFGINDFSNWLKSSKYNKNMQLNDFFTAHCPLSLHVSGQIDL
jgi:hypothetical protein